MKLFSEEELTHFGILGMKWGVRKDKRPSAHSIRKQIKQANKKWEDPKNISEKISNSILFKNNSKEAYNMFKKLEKKGLKGRELQEAYTLGLVDLLNTTRNRDKLMSNPVKTKQIVFESQRVNGELYIKGRVEKILKNQGHKEVAKLFKK